MVSTKDPIQQLLTDQTVSASERDAVLVRAYWLIEQQCVVIPGSMRFIRKQITNALAGVADSKIAPLTAHSARIANAFQHERERHKVWCDVRRREAAKYESEVWV